MKKELQQLKDYLQNPETERAKDYLVFPLFESIFGKEFKKESSASGADIYIPGKLIVELKSKHDDWVAGLFQALHYGKKGNSFANVSVISQNFIGLWKIKELPEFAIELWEKADSSKSASEIGIANAKKLNKGQINKLLEATRFQVQENLYKDLDLSEYEDYLRNLDSGRQQINDKNFIRKIEILKGFFDSAMDTIHCFYGMIPYWDGTSTVPEAKPIKANYLEILGKHGKQRSDEIKINPRYHQEFIKFVESHYIFKDEEKGLDIDYYFSRFDEVLASIDPEYTRQHGIYFTNINLSKFALWFVHYYYEKKLAEKYIIFDPAGGSGNLVTSWRKNHLKHKIVSELQPDLLKTIELRMKQDPMHVASGFTIVPKTIENKGLNFIDKSAEEYLSVIEKALNEKNLRIDKPFAFLLNPPFKNTDENEKERIGKEADYIVHSSILEITGNDSSKERYVAFLTQILRIAEIQVKTNPDFKPLLMIFTPTSWLIPRPSYSVFREKFDQYFKYETGFIVNGKEFFKDVGDFPIAFTIWSYNFSAKGNKNVLRIRDFTHLLQNELRINWNVTFDELNKTVLKFIKGTKIILFDTSRSDIRENLPKIKHAIKNETFQQPRYDYSHAKRDVDIGRLVSGFPLKDKERHFNLKRKCGETKGEFIGFYDDNTPVRLKQDNYNRMSQKPDRVWFRLDNDFKSINKTRILNGAPDKYGFCAYDIESANIIFTWYALTKALNQNYPIWANQFDIWKPNIQKNREKYFNSLCFSF